MRWIEWDIDGDGYGGEEGERGEEAYRTRSFPGTNLNPRGRSVGVGAAVGGVVVVGRRLLGTSARRIGIALMLLPRGGRGRGGAGGACLCLLHVYVW